VAAVVPSVFADLLQPNAEKRKRPTTP